MRVRLAGGHASGVRGMGLGGAATASDVGCGVGSLSDRSSGAAGSSLNGSSLG